MRYSQPSITPPTANAPRRRGAHHAMSIQDAKEAYLLHHESTGSSLKTYKWHQHCISAFQTFCEQQGIATLEAVTTEDAQRWVLDIQKMPTARGKRRVSRTISWYVRSLWAFYRWCGPRGFIGEDITVLMVIRPAVSLYSMLRQSC